MLQHNETITFGRSGSITQFNPIGFDITENSPQSWTILPSCEFEIALSIPRNDLTFVLDATPFLVPGMVSSQSVFVYVNGLFQGFHIFRGSSLMEFSVRRHAINSRTTRMQFVLPDAVSPQALGLSTDLRELGLAFTALRFGSV